MNQGRRLFAAASSILFIFCIALNAFAAEESGSAAKDQAIDIFKWINFAIVAAAVIWVFAKKLPPAFRSHAESIGSAITKATAAKEAADREVREAETKLAQLAQEIVALRATAQQEAAGEAERIRALARSEAAKVGLAAHAEIEAAERAARMELKALAASLAVGGAESLLVKQLTSEAAQESLVEAFVKGLEGRPN
jgi:F-type H+-transporting ATPase subunit b